ncbi:hypothetical protein LRH25_10630 [Ideonella azotifigens]|uniref:Uncharacterized protein n=1 Tax=Ideonella azotifigens TaxID=513160 RepID=A0ABN1KET2_9BURK|nr:hypothetical protein [Ideonella azotifigens]MCD2340800.1 hypothetical protein [Ideonella azotifigens]
MKPAAETVPNTAPVPPVATSAGPQLSMHVDRLVLHGFPFSQHDGTRIEQAFQDEVQRLVIAGEMRLDRLGAQALDQLRVAELRLDGGAGPEQLGRKLAAALLREIAP